jgi:hypothetical protein
MTLDFENLDWECGQVSIPGIALMVYAIPKCDIELWPGYLDPPVTAADEVTLKDNIDLVTGKTWKRINVIDTKSLVVCEPQGEIRSQTFLNKGTFKTALTSEEATAFAKKANNTDMVYLVQEKNSAKFRLLGNRMFNTLTKPMLDLGGEPTSERGTTFEVEVSDPIPAPFYIGGIMTDDGEVGTPVI